MNTSSEVDVYFEEGCGRCARHATPDCSVHLWSGAMEQVRRIVLDSGLTEERKWGQPCYTFKGANVLLFGAFRSNAVLSFIKGVLIQDDHRILVPPGKNSHSARVFKYTSEAEVSQWEPVLRDYIQQAIQIEISQVPLPSKPESRDEMPAELQAALQTDSELNEAFEALTPGRKRSYFIHISGAKAEKTRENRVMKCIPKILAGKGFNER